jgi:UDP-glucoronosyl and UDP-glucosyl transferase
VRCYITASPPGVDRLPRESDPGDLGPIPANTVVVRVAPQIELLKRSALCITHAGLNTTLEALAQGVPLVAIPIGYDHGERIRLSPAFYRIRIAPSLL